MEIVKEEARKVKAALYISNLNHLKAQRRLFRHIRYTEGNLKDDSTNYITIISPNGKIQEIH